jgi:hypothetical protein
LVAPKGAARIDSYSVFACSPEGALLLCNSLSFHLGNCVQQQMPLKIGERVTALSEFVDGGFVAGTSSGDIYVIDLQSSGSINVVSLRKRNSVLQRVGSWLTGANNSSLRTLLRANSKPLIRGKHDEIIQIKVESRAQKSSRRSVMLHFMGWLKRFETHGYACDNNSQVVIMSGQTIQRIRIDMPHRSKVCHTI